MITAVDTNILLDLLVQGSPDEESSSERLAAALEAGPVVLSEAVFTELASQFASLEELEQFLQEVGLGLERSRTPTLYRAGVAWSTYLRRRSAELQCQQCGQLQEVCCERCRSLMRSRQHVLADFLIGAHALLQANRLLTRDRGYYSTYFPELSLD